MSDVARRYLGHCQRQMAQLKDMEWLARLQTSRRVGRVERLALKDRRVFLEARIRILELAAKV